MAMVKVSVLLIGIVTGLVFGNWVDGFEEILNFNETAASFLDSEHMEAFGASKAARATDVLMVGLTLIQSAGAKGAGTFFLLDRKSTRLNSSHSEISRMPSSA